ncbi:hypothetical protein ULMS_24550 [Patiriisocius marinistellae]|uniref:Outer membrane protein beta-barrel domain-containing protein n=1 Tax=Patiriisocius marinistellae TaxID=2494560 RepID=A0A5J4FW36_9FLAO|nr:outer membrane beta-barrel protein [Patiriisocius marinistellae]GEQ86947.1 hypothetical protein ULMS_24550 [Patiriisocius marinistellae]
MKTHTLVFALSLWIISIFAAVAQEAEMDKKRDLIVQAEKAALKAEVDNINKRLDNGTINLQEAEGLKVDAATKHALNIENKVAILENRVALNERNGETVESKSKFKITFGDDGLDFNNSNDTTYKRKEDIRTYSSFTFAFGLNNAIADGRSLDDSPYKIGGSRFAEIGLSWSTRVFKESNFLRVRYGLSFQFNGLKADDNKYFVENGAQTELEEYPLDLNKQKLRMDHLVIPLHFEFGPSKKIVRDDYFRYNTENSLRIGLGGYAGVNLSTVQKLKFDDEGQDVKQKQKGNFNTNNFIYGLSAYAGWGETSIYLKYDLNPIFKNNIIEERNVSLGIRFDFE